MEHEVDLGEDNTGLIITAVIICMVLSGLSVISRVTSRYLKKTSITQSDWLILGGLAGAWAISLIIIQCEVDKLAPMLRNSFTDEPGSGKERLGKACEHC